MQIDWGKVTIILSVMVGLIILGVVHVLDGGFIGGVITLITGVIIGNGKTIKTGDTPGPVITSRSPGMSPSDVLTMKPADPAPTVTPQNP